MDFGGAPRTNATSAVQATVRTDVSIQTGSAPVELPAEKTVQSAPAGEAVQLDIRGRASERRHEQVQQQQSRRDDAAVQKRLDDERRQQELRSVIDRRLVIDPRTRSVVLEKTNRDTGETVEQLPDEALLKLRAFSRDLIERAREAAASSSHAIERTA